MLPGCVVAQLVEARDVACIPYRALGSVFPPRPIKPSISSGSVSWYLFRKKVFSLIVFSKH